jgi:hypothetical protein
MLSWRPASWVVFVGGCGYGGLVRYRFTNKSVFSVKYQLIWCLKYRRDVLVGPVERRLKEIIGEVVGDWCGDRGGDDGRSRAHQTRNGSNRCATTTPSAREAPAAEPVRARRTGQTASEASLRTDLELAKQDNRRLRAEVDRLKQSLRERLGTQLELASRQSLQQRIDELTEANQRYRGRTSVWQQN